ncbi:MAG TPA: RidA family protein [Gemmatimonadaceae bacterium]|jgi:2-iminobutanoate/2-iminopropanoate deaminase|nr:RidA family protein [Gemmatimonadaceae bacterium]
MKQSERQWQPFQHGGDVPPPVGAYSPAARAGDFVFVSGQVPRDPASGQLIGDDITSQTKQVMKNVERALGLAGATLGDVVSIVAYLANVDDWGTFNTVYKEIMPSPFPTRTALGADLRGILVEVSAVAYAPRP